MILLNHNEGGGRCAPPPTTYNEIGIKRFVYVHIAYPKMLFDKFSDLRVLGMKKALKFYRFRE